MTFLETIGSFPESTVSQMLYRNEKHIGLGPYTHSSHMASIDHLPVSVKEFNHPSIGPDVISGLPQGYNAFCMGVAQGVL